MIESSQGTISIDTSSPYSSFSLLTDSPDVFRILVAHYLSLSDVRSLRLTNKATKATIDSILTSIHLQFEKEEDEEEDAPVYYENPEFVSSIDEENSYYNALLLKSAAYKNFPGIGDCWSSATSVHIESCPFSHLTQRLLDNASVRWPCLHHISIVNCRLGRRDHAPVLLSFLANNDPTSNHSSCFRELTTLELRGCGIDSINDLQLLATKLHAPRLRELDLSDNKLLTLQPLHGAGALWPRLDTLTLCRNRYLSLTVESLAVLVEEFPLLDDVDVSGVTMYRGSLRPLISTPWQSLKWITLSNCGINDEILRESLCCCLSGDGGVDGAQGKHLDREEQETSRGDNTASSCHGWSALERLDLRQNTIQSIQNLLPVAHLAPKLRSLDLSSNLQLRGDGLKALATTTWPSLQVFEACNVVLAAPSIIGLTSAIMPRLRFLNLRNTIMSWKAVDELAKGKWPELRRVDLGGANGVHLRRAGPSLCSAAWPKLRVLILRKGSARIKNTNRQALLKLLTTWPNLKVRCEG